MNQFEQALLHVLELAFTDGKGKVQRTIRPITAGCTFFWALGMFLAWLLQSGTPAFVCAAICGAIWFIPIGRVALAAWIAQMIPEEWLKKLGLSVENFTPSKTTYTLGTVGMWQIASLILLGVFPFWKSGMYYSLYAAFWAVMVATWLIVATSEGDIRFWRKIYGWSIAGIFAGILLLLLMPEEVNGLRSWLDRRATYTVAETAFHNGVASDTQAMLQQTDQNLRVLVNQRRYYNLQGWDYPADKEAEIVRLTALHEDLVRERDVPIAKAPGRFSAEAANAFGSSLDFVSATASNPWLAGFACFALLMFGWVVMKGRS
ncbi:MAG: hypothetical protein HYV13_01825 [Candidatus Doudnabacteria bacterium]|nr:hypothetical protein [Candidatus Doudnabacteria bacterium]